MDTPENWKMVDMENKILSKEVLEERTRCIDIIENTPLGYMTGNEHKLLEAFCDIVISKIKSGISEEWVHEE